MLCAKLFGITPSLTRARDRTCARCSPAPTRRSSSATTRCFLDEAAEGVEKVDLGEAWVRLTGLPFVYAVWAGRAGALGAEDVRRAAGGARTRGSRIPTRSPREYCPGDPLRQAVAARYLRDNIKYYLGDEERAGLEQFYRYAAELGLVASAGPLAFF